MRQRFIFCNTQKVLTGHTDKVYSSAPNHESKRMEAIHHDIARYHKQQAAAQAEMSLTLQCQDDLAAEVLELFLSKPASYQLPNWRGYGALTGSRLCEVASDFDGQWGEQRYALTVAAAKRNKYGPAQLRLNRIALKIAQHVVD